MTKQDPKQSRSRSFIAVLMAGCVLAGCVTTPHMADRARTLTPGVTTRAEATALLGPPNSTSSMAGGRVLLQWLGITFTDNYHIVILFDASGRMVEITHIFEP